MKYEQFAMAFFIFMIFLLFMFAIGYVKDKDARDAKAFCSKNNLSYKLTGSDSFPKYICWNPSGEYLIKEVNGEWKFDG